MINPQAVQLIATAAVVVAVVSGTLAGAAYLGHLRLADRHGACASLSRMLLAVMTTAGLVALVADHPGVWQLALGT
jgi:hypothetical protein